MIETYGTDALRFTLTAFAAMGRDIATIAEGFDGHVPKGYVSFAMAFSVCVELLNIRMRRRSTKVVHLHADYAPDASSGGNGTGAGSSPPASPSPRWPASRRPPSPSPRPRRPPPPRPRSNHC